MSGDKTLLVTSETKIMTSKPLIQNIFFWEDLEKTIFLTTLKLQMFLIKQPLKTQAKLKELEIMY